MKRRGFLKALFAAPAAPAILASLPAATVAPVATAAPVAASAMSAAIVATAAKEAFWYCSVSMCSMVEVSHPSSIQTSGVETEFSDEDFDSDYWEGEDE